MPDGEGIWGKEKEGTMKKKKWKSAVSTLLAATLAFSYLPEAGSVASAAPSTEAVLAEFGTPVIDGEMDEVWSRAAEYELQFVHDGTSDGKTTAVTRILWDDYALYTYTIVYDEELTGSSSQNHEKDSVEIFLDELANGGTSYQSDDVHYRVNYLGEKTTDSGDASRFTASVRTFDTTEETETPGNAGTRGYIVESMLCLEYAVPENGVEMGFDLQVNACTGNSRDYCLSLLTSDNDAYQNPGAMGRLILQGREEGEQSGIWTRNLEKSLEKAAALDLSLYTPDTRENVERAVSEANALLAAGEYTQEQLDAARSKLEEAMEALHVAAQYVVPYGSAVVDGTAESAWDGALKLRVENALSDTDSGDGTADLKIMWDEAFLYILAEVEDSDLYIAGGKGEEEDSVTVTLAQSTAAGKDVKNIVLTAGGEAVTFRYEGGFDWGSFSTYLNKVYSGLDTVYSCAAKTERGYRTEAVVAWSELGITPADGSNLALEAVVNNYAGGTEELIVRRAIALTAYPENTEGGGSWMEPPAHNAGLYAENLISFDLGKDASVTTVAADIGRYSLIRYAKGFYDAYVAPYPEKESFDAAKIDAAIAYALSAEATAEGIAEQRAILEKMQAVISADNYEGKLMSKYGTPIIDGVPDDAVWENAYVYTTNTDNQGQYGKIRALWDEKAVYLLVEVNDSTYDVTGSDAHQKDSVEFFFIPTKDAEQDSFGRDGGQWRINRANQTTVTFGSNEPFYAKLSETYDEDQNNTGYIVEARYEFADSMEITNESFLNFELSINLCENGSRTASVAFAEGNSYSHPNTSGQIIFLDRNAGQSSADAGYNPYALLKVLDKALVMKQEDYDQTDYAENYDREQLQKYYEDAVSGGLTEAQIGEYYANVVQMMSKITYDGVHKSVLGYEARHEYPDAFTMADGSMVESAEDWKLRHDEIQDLYEFYMYGKLPDAEETGLEKAFAVDAEDEDTFIVTVTREGVGSAAFRFKVDFPEGEAPEGGWPYIINYGGNISGAQNAGYAVVEYSEYGNVASNDSYYNGVFYEMYPECKGSEYITGVGPLAARAWGAGLIIDSIEAKTGKLALLDPAKSAVTGFSFLGKTALVTGVLEERIAVTNPQHSGIGGAAPFRYSSQGKFYDAEEYGIANDYLITKIEPIGQVQGQGMAWVKTIFADFLGGDNTPFDTYMLLSLVAPRGLYVTTGHYDNGVNPEGMYASYLGAKQVYKFLGAEDKIAFGGFETSLSSVHSTGTGENEAFFAFCDYYFYGTELPENFYHTIYDKSPDRAEYDVIRMPLTESYIQSRIDKLDALLKDAAATAEEKEKIADELLDIMRQKADGYTSGQIWNLEKRIMEAYGITCNIEFENESGQTLPEVFRITGLLTDSVPERNTVYTLRVAPVEKRPVISSEYNADTAAVFDLKLYVNGVEKQLTSPVTISLKIPAGIDKTGTIKALHYTDGTNAPEVLDVIIADDVMCFTTNSFSSFVVANLSSSGSGEGEQGDGGKSDGDSGSGTDNGTAGGKGSNTDNDTDEDNDSDEETGEESKPSAAAGTSGNGNSQPASNGKKQDTTRQDTIKKDTAKQDAADDTHTDDGRTESGSGNADEAKDHTDDRTADKADDKTDDQSKAEDGKEKEEKENDNGSAAGVEEKETEIKTGNHTAVVIVIVLAVVLAGSAGIGLVYRKKRKAE